MVANQGVADGSHTVPYYAVVVAKSLFDAGQLKRVADLKGRPVNVLSKGSLAELNVDQALRSDGLSLQDVQAQQLAMPDTLAALQNGSLAASFLLEPFITLGQQQGIIEVLVNLEQLAPGREITELFYSGNFAQQAAVGNAFIAAYLQGVRDYVRTFFGGGGDRATAVSQLIAHLPVKEPALYDRMGMPAINPNGQINAVDLKNQQDWYVSQGEVQQAIDLSQAIDDQFARYALGILGPYPP
jgi:NitT/TauT family transport system substrate-binding protein